MGTSTEAPCAFGVGAFHEYEPMAFAEIFQEKVQCTFPRKHNSLNSSLFGTDDIFLQFFAIESNALGRSTQITGRPASNLG